MLYIYKPKALYVRTCIYHHHIIVGLEIKYRIAGNVCEELNFAFFDFDGIPQTFCPQIIFGASVYISSEVLCKPQTLNLQTLLFTTNCRI